MKFNRLILTCLLCLAPSFALADACTNDLTGAAIVNTQAQAICEASVSAIGQDLVPGADGTYDLGSSTKEWQDLYIDGTANLDAFVSPFSVVAGANTACSTTCTGTCLFGVNTASATADIVNCADATADECLCNE